MGAFGLLDDTIQPLVMHPHKFTYSTYPENKKHVSLTLLDLYLIRPIGPTIQDLISTIQTVIAGIPPEEGRKLFGESIDINSLLSKYGRFWFYKGILYYRTPQGSDMPVNRIELGKGTSQDHLIVRINGQIIPIVALEQLRILIKYHGQGTVYSDLYEKIGRHYHEIKPFIDHERRS